MTNRVLITVLVIAAVGAVYMAPAFAMSQADTENAMIQLALTDFESVHQKIYERCLKEYRETASSFKETTDRWGKTNYPALREFKLIFRDKLVAGGMSPESVDSMMKSNVTMLTEGLQKYYADLPVSELQKICSGKFMDSFLSQMNFASFLDKVKAKMENRQ